MKKCINSLFENQNIDIYVTGSNSKLLSSEISTYLTGRFVLIPVYTLSFTEFIEFKKTFVSTLQNESDEAYFDLYLKSGGFPFIAKTNHTQKKYYLPDISFKYNQLGYSPKTVASVLENLVYLELRRRGYSIYIGKYAEKEIDFVAVKQDEKLYVQVCRTLPENSDRELANLKAIKDNYPKYVVTMDSSVCGNENGIKIVHIKDFLQNKN